MSGSHLRNPDRGALRILFGTFWSSSGWRTERSTDPDDLALAIEAGVMFAPAATTTHDEAIAAAIEANRALDMADVGAAFALSLPRAVRGVVRQA